MIQGPDQKIGEIVKRQKELESEIQQLSKNNNRCDQRKTQKWGEMIAKKFYH